MNEHDNPHEETAPTGPTGPTEAFAWSYGAGEPGTTPDVEDEPGAWTAGRHPVDVGQLVMGVAFLGLVGVWALLGTDAVGGRDVRWLLPLPWVLAGAAGLLAVALGSRRRRSR